MADPSLINPIPGVHLKIVKETLYKHILAYF